MAKTDTLNIRIEPELKKEADDIAKNPNKYKSYNNLSEILKDINNDETI